MIKESIIKPAREHKKITTLLIAMVIYVPLLNPILPSTEFGSGLPDIDFQRVIFIALMAVIGWKVISGRTFYNWNNWFYWLFASAFVVAISPSWTDAYNYNVTLFQDIMTQTMLPLLVAIIAIAVLQNENSIKRYCIHAVIVCNILSLYAIYQFITKSSFSESGELRSSATLGNANLLAIYLVLLQPIIIYATETKVVAKWLGYLTLAILVIAIITTISRKGMFTCFITFEIYFFLTRRYKELFLSLGFLVLAGIIAMGYSQITQRFDDKALSTDLTGKQVMAQAGIEMFKTNPIYGLGYKGYYENFRDYWPGQTGRDKYDAHNEYVTALANFGLIGFIAFMGVFLYPLNRGWKLFKFYRRRKLKRESMRVMIGLTSLISFMMSQYYAGTIYFHTPLAVCLLFSNIALMLVPRYPEKREAYA